MAKFSDETIEECKHVLGIMREVVDEAGSDFTYQRIAHGERSWPKCYYVDNGCASCLIGRVLEKLGWTIDQLLEIEGKTPLSFGYKFSELTKTVMNAAQSAQDRGCTWTQCYVFACNHFEYVTGNKA
jgi:hypothetical protein